MVFNVDSVDEFFRQTERALDIDITDGHRLVHQYDSFRAYSWIVRIPDVSELVQNVENTFNFSDGNDILSLAAKKISGLSFGVGVIQADKVNDKFHYPGRPTTNPVTFTFDNLLKGDVEKLLYTWMRTSYDPIFGVHSSPVVAGDQFKRTIEIIQLDHQRNPAKLIKLYGAFPTKYQIQDLDYANEAFNTIECEVKYDFMTVYNVQDNAFENFLGSIIPGL